MGLARRITRGGGERTAIKELRANTVPQKGLVNSYDGDVVDTITVKGVILKIRTTIGITPVWLSNITGGATPTRGISSRGIGLSSIESISNSPRFIFLPCIPFVNNFFFQASHYDAWASYVNCGMIKGNLNDPLGTYPLVSARAGNYSLNGIAPPTGQYGELRKQNVAIQMMLKRGNLSGKTRLALKGTKGFRIQLNINSSSLTNVNIYSYLIENAELYSSNRYIFANTNHLNNASKVIQNRLFGKLKINSFENPITRV